MPKVIEVKMAKATDDDIKRVREFFQMLEGVLEHGTYTTKPNDDKWEEFPVPADDDRLCKLIREHWGKNGPGSWGRVVDGMAMLLSNCCDPDLEYLEFKPEIKAAMAAAGLGE